MKATESSGQKRCRCKYNLPNYTTEFESVPIYEYSCSSCEREFEVLVRGNEQAKCPKCGNIKLQRLLSVPAAHTGAASRLPISESCNPACSTGVCRTGLCGPNN